MATAFKIEKGLAPPTGARGPAPKYPWRELEVGDSFLVPLSVAPTKSIASQACNFGTRNGMKLSCRMVDGGTRIWRIA